MAKKKSAKGKKRQKQLEKARQARALRFKDQGGKGQSKYARKKQYLHSHGGFGFEYDRKPW